MSKSFKDAFGEEMRRNDDYLTREAARTGSATHCHACGTALKYGDKFRIVNYRVLCEPCLLKAIEQDA